MLIQRVAPEEIIITFDTNPSATMAQKWAEQFQNQLTGKEKLARVDTRKLPMLSSLLIGVIVKLFRAMEKQGGTISVDLANEEVHKVFQVFQLTRLFEVKVIPF